MSDQHLRRRMGCRQRLAPLGRPPAVLWAAPHASEHRGRVGKRPSWLLPSSKNHATAGPRLCASPHSLDPRWRTSNFSWDHFQHQLGSPDMSAL